MGNPKKAVKGRAPSKSSAKKAAPKDDSKASQKGLPEGWDRKTYIIHEVNIERIDWYSFNNRMKVKAGLNEILETFFKEHRDQDVPKKENEVVRKWKAEKAE